MTNAQSTKMVAVPADLIRRLHQGWAASTDVVGPMRELVEYARSAARQQAAVVQSNTAKRRASLFLDSLDSACNEVKTLRLLLAASPQAERDLVIADGLSVGMEQKEAEEFADAIEPQAEQAQPTEAVEPAGSYQKGYDEGRNQGTKHRVADIEQLRAERDSFQRAGIQSMTERNELLGLLRQLYRDLPRRRTWLDPELWLDPVLERRIKAHLDKPS